MKKYKLIKEYPGSPKLNTILTHEELQYCNWDEYYEEIVEKDYEILSLIEDKFIYLCDKYSKDYIHQLFNTIGVNIHSVKRLSDLQIFTIGDKTEFGDIIKYFKIDNKSNLLIIGYKDCEDILEFVKHSKQKLFCTEDGVDIFKGDKYYYINSNFNNPWEVVNTKADCPDLINKNDLTYKRFSTKEAAEEYILMNKPILSVNEVIDCFSNWSTKLTKKDWSKTLKKRAKKLNNKN